MDEESKQKIKIKNAWHECFENYMFNNETKIVNYNFLPRDNK